MIKIRKRAAPEGTYYELEDFAYYIQTLRERGIDPPTVRYRIFVSPENETSIRESVGEDWESQIPLLFKLSPATDIPFEFHKQPL